MTPTTVREIYMASTWVVPVILAVTFHEAAHGFIAYQLGDDTAWRMGRVTFNPLKHVDPFGTIVLPALLLLVRSPFLFGYAKPVPVNFGRLNRPRRDMVWVALAGPTTNILLAMAASVLFYSVALLPAGYELRRIGLPAILYGAIPLPHNAAGWVAANLANALIINVLLCVFNMIPLPPLDGGRVAVGLLPRPLALPLARLERYGIPILLLFLFVFPWLGAKTGFNFDILNWVIGVPGDALLRFVLAITGQG